jgi:MFS family permease
VPFVADLRTVLRGRDFRSLFAVRLVSQAGDGVFQVALASLVFFSPERAATAQAAAGAFAVTVLPYTLVGPFAGVLLDRWRRRQVLLVANVVRAGMVLGVAALVARTSMGPAGYAAVLACLSVNRFFLAGLGASLPHVVPRHELVMANAVSPTCGTLAALAGGGLGYLVRSRLPEGDSGDALTLLVAAAGYLAAAALATRMAPDLLGPDEQPPGGAGRPGLAHAWHALVDGARHVHERRAAFDALAAIGVSRFAYGVATIATILLCRNHFADPADVGAGLALLVQVFAASGIGFGLAALVTPPATGRWGPEGWIRRCFVLAALVQAVFVLWLPVPVALGGAVLLGLAVQGSKICVDAIVQREVDDGFRGRVFAFYDVVFNVAFVAAAACAALVVPPDGYSPVLYGVIGALYAAAALAYGRVRSTPPPAAAPTSAAAPPGPPARRAARRPGAAGAGAGRPARRRARAARPGRP